MELNSDIVRLLRNIEEAPMIMVFFSAFGVILYLVLLAIIIGPIQKMFKIENAPLINAYFYATGITWILGFIIEMLLFFMGVSGLQLVLIWLTLHIICVFFCIFNYSSLHQLFNKITKLKTPSN